MSDVTNAKVKIDKIAYTKNDAEQGNFLPEEQIYADAFEDIEVEDMGNGTYLVTNDGEAIGWTTAEGLELDATTTTNNKYQEIQQLQQKLTEYTDMRDGNQISDEEYHKMADPIMLKILQFRQKQYDDRFASGQMEGDEYSQKSKEIKKQISDLKDNMMRAAHVSVVKKAQEKNAEQGNNSVISSRQALESKLASYTDLHDSGQMSDEAYNQKASEIMGELLGYDLASYTDLHDSGQMSDEAYNQKVKEIENKFLSFQKNNSNVDTTSDSSDINIKNSLSPISVNKTAFGYQTMNVENGKLVIRQFDNLGRETALSKSRNGFSETPKEVLSSVMGAIKFNNAQSTDSGQAANTSSLDDSAIRAGHVKDAMWLKQQHEKANALGSTLGTAVLAGADQIAHLANDIATSQVQDPAGRLQAGTINGSGSNNSYNPLDINGIKRLERDGLIYKFDGTNLEQIKKLYQEKGAKFGIDISHYQYANKPIDWKAVKNSGISYVMIQWGGRYDGEYITDGQYHGVTTDQIRQNIMDAIDADLDVGLYTWGEPSTEAKAIEEAKWTLDFISTLPAEYQEKIKKMPIGYDLEELSKWTGGQSKEQLTKNVEAFNKTLADAGYKTMTYSYRSGFNSYFDGKKLSTDTNSIWVSDPCDGSPYEGSYQLHQYNTSDDNLPGVVNGIEGRVDLNVYYENPNAGQADITSDSKDINTGSSSMSKVNVQKTVGGYKATYFENGKLVTKEYDAFGREAINSRISSKNATPNEVNIAVRDAIKNNNVSNKLSQTSSKSSVLGGVLASGVSSATNKMMDNITASNKPSQTSSKSNVLGDVFASSVSPVANKIIENFTGTVQSDSFRLKAAQINGIKTEKGSLVIDNAGEKSRIYMYDNNGIAAITELNTNQKVKDIKYENGVVSATFENGKIQKYKIDENGNLKAFGFYGGRQNYEDATDAQKQIVDIAKNEKGEYSLNTTPNMCWAYVNDVYASAGLIERGHLGSATLEMYEIEKNWGLSENFDNIPVGAAVFTDHSAGDGVWEGGYSAGHVAIYIGNGMVRENIGGIVDTPLDQWINTWKNNVPGARVAWGWPGGKDLTETNKLTKVISVENSTKITNNNSVKKDNNITKQQNIKTYKNGASYHQPQGNGIDYNIGNCGTTSMLQAVNMLEGDNKYTDNIKEWEDMGSYSEAIAVDGGKYIKTWLDNKGLSNDIEVVQAYDSSNPNSKVSQNISGADDLINHLKNGEVCILSASGPVFKQNDGGYKNLNHVVTFYMGDNNKVYCNDPGSNPSLGAGVEYTKEDIDQFFTHLVGSVSLKKKN